jgi:hypothetical protein
MITIFLMETYPAGQMTLWLKSIKLPDGSPKYSLALINSTLPSSYNSASKADWSDAAILPPPLDIPTGIFAIIVVTTFLTGALAGIWNICNVPPLPGLFPAAPYQRITAPFASI